MKRSLLTEPPDWKWWAKCLAMAAVGAATGVLTLSADATPLQTLCTAIIGAGAMFGIGSGGMGRR